MAIVPEISFEDVALFRDSLFSENIEVKLDTIRKLPLLAQAIGPERTRLEIFDALDSEISALEDEILYNLAEELEKFLPLVGGPDFSQELFKILLKISKTVDETLVRDRAIISIKGLLNDLPDDLVEKYIVNDLVTTDESETDWFSHKCAILTLIPICYPKASSESKTLLRQLFKNIFDDNIALTRKAAGESLVEFIKVLEMNAVLNEFVPVLKQIEQDEQDCVKINAIDITLSIARRSKNQEIKNDMLQIIEKLSNSSSWKIRQRIAFKMNEIGEIFRDDSFIPVILYIYQSLTNDSENEVRICATDNIYLLSKQINEAISSNAESNLNFENIFKENIIPIVTALFSDECEEVGNRLSSKILMLSTVISKEVFIDCVLPFVVQGLKDAKNLKFKENLLMTFDFIPNGIDIVRNFSTLIEVIKYLIESSEISWRARRSLLLIFVYVSKFNSADFFNEQLLGNYILLLKDPVFAVRRTATIVLPILAKQFGSKWLIKDFMPQIYGILKKEHYLFRYVLLFCIQEILNSSLTNNKFFVNYFIFLNKQMQSEEKDKTIRTICKILRLNFKLKESLQDKFYAQMISSYEDNNNISGENVKIYCEEIFEKLLKADNFNIFVHENPEDVDLTYLEGILILLNKKILTILKILLKDPINNIKDRAKYTLTKIQAFCNYISLETSADWAKDAIKNISEEYWLTIDNEICTEIEKIKKKYFSEDENTEILETSTPSNQNIQTSDLEPNKTSSTTAELNFTESIPDLHKVQQTQLLEQVDEMKTVEEKTEENN